jgi:hypothetical protein
MTQGLNSDDTFLLEEWETWYTFSTYLKSSSYDLEKLAREVVENEISDCAILSDGKTFCRGAEEIIEGVTLLKVSGDKKEASITFEHEYKEDPLLTSYASESWYAGSQFLYAQERQVAYIDDFPALHVRAFLRPFIFTKEEERITSVYPVIVFYKTGVLTIEFRIIGPDDPIEIQAFIKNFINIYQCDYDYVFVPVALGTLAPTASFIYEDKRSGILSRRKIVKNREKKKSAYSQLSAVINSGDFEFEMAPLAKAGSSETFTSVAQTLFMVIGYLVSKPSGDAEYILRGIPTLPEMGNYWSGRPHVHIIRHSDQKDTALENEASHKNSFGQMLARSYDSSQDFSAFVPTNSRAFSDFASYITSAVTLWIWSKNGIQQQMPSPDPNRGYFIYERQVQVEVLEYGFMLYKSLANRSQELRDYADVIAARRDLADLKTKMLEASSYGEVRDLLNNGWKQMNLSSIETQISENLSILESEIKFIESKQTNSFRALLTVLGLIISTSFSTSIVSPAWKALNLWIPTDANLAELYFISISAITMGSVITLLKRIIYN